jgi:hypothetical protein
VNNFARTVECTSPLNVLRHLLYTCPCVFIAGHFYAFMPARARAPGFEIKVFLPTTGIKKKIKIQPAARVKGELEYSRF